MWQQNATAGHIYEPVIKHLNCNHRTVRGGGNMTTESVDTGCKSFLSKLS